MPDWGAGSGHIEVSMSEAVAVVTLRRPDQLNALTVGMRRELAAILRHFGDGHLVRGIVVTGTGRAFSAGLDLKEAAELPPGGLMADVELFHDITRAALETRVPVVAALNGIAVGGACEMTLCFDARLGTPTAEYFLPENNIGLTISNGSSVLLPRLIGPARSLDLLLSGPGARRGRQFAHRGAAAIEDVDLERRSGTGRSVDRNADDKTIGPGEFARRGRDGVGIGLQLVQLGKRARAKDQRRAQRRLRSARRGRIAINDDFDLIWQIDRPSGGRHSLHEPRQIERRDEFRRLIRGAVKWIEQIECPAPAFRLHQVRKSARPFGRPAP